MGRTAYGFVRGSHRDRLLVVVDVGEIFKEALLLKFGDWEDGLRSWPSSCENLLEWAPSFKMLEGHDFFCAPSLFVSLFTSKCQPRD